ncbi:hypothetical protein QBC34DRAFT_150232 [Podospora aff. communis PSN243]|uniref:Apple domain-containing protein n=1 Tax=Podospora aff. communis PSN243 TaxID=3040156 RepID=A0AAV9GE67_9PEZI|nr:hypothetical protein QBC34DRAFT_150232 [Podospora aff. communis PSN243]
MATDGASYKYGGPPVESPHANRDYEGLQPVGNIGADGLQYHKELAPPPVTNAYYVAPPEPTPPPAAAPKRIFGMQRSVFALTISNILFAIALIAVGVVLSRDDDTTTQGITGSAANSTVCPSVPTGNNNNASSNAVAPAISSGGICFNTRTQLAASSGGGTPNPGTTIPSCPLDPNKTEYTVPGTNLRFRRDCNSNYVGDDIANFPTRTMEDCIALCAQLNLFPSSFFGPCKSVAWSFDIAVHGYQGDRKAFCWLKNSTLPRKFQEGIESAILL